MKRLLTLEPALVRSVASVVVLIGANVGLNINAHVDSAVTVVLAVLALLPLIQAWWTREGVTANGNVVERVDAHDFVVAGPANELVPTDARIRRAGSGEEEYPLP